MPTCLGQVPGYHCFGGTYLTRDVCFEQCNDGVITQSESCEDGDTVNGDGCSSSCLVEIGWMCSGAIPNTCDEICGDG